MSEEELMYIKNFPTLYSDLPEPKIVFLRMYIDEAKGKPQEAKEEERETCEDLDEESESLNLCVPSS